jgi:Na+-transporting NADH:ubiquinone oxidoreductase subunit C
MPRSGVGYTVAFSAAVCVVCAVLVSGAAVALRERQAVNVELDRKQNVLMVAGVMTADEDLSPAEIETRFAAFEPIAIDLRTGQPAPEFAVAGYDQKKAASDPDTSFAVPPNAAQITRLPNYAVAYRKLDASGTIELLVLPIEGKGLWSTMFGFLAMEGDAATIRGLTFYQHGETPGLGGEVDNPRWKQLWPGRVAFEDANPVIEVTKGPAGSVAVDPHRVDGLAGATITSRGVTNMLRFWLGEHGFGPYLNSLRTGGTNG